MGNKKTKILSAFFLFFFLLPAVTRAATYDFFVDKNSLESTENGSAFVPWKTIGAALAHIENEGLKSKTIYIKNGTYFESVSVRNNTDLIGESENGTIIDATGSSYAVNFLSTKSDLKNITVKSADGSNVVVDRKSKIYVRNCTIEDAGRFGIEVKKSSSSSRYMFRISNSKISESKSQGMYIEKRKISIKDNEIFLNGEEGVDLHSGTKGTVSGNSIRENGESGVELILASVNLVIRKNSFRNNDTQGITVQAYSAKKKGKVKIKENTIVGNDAYGIRFANYTRSIGPNKFKVFIDKNVKLSKNTISDNDSGNIHYE